MGGGSGWRSSPALVRQQDSGSATAGQEGLFSAPLLRPDSDHNQGFTSSQKMIDLTFILFLLHFFLLLFYL